VAQDYAYRNKNCKLLTHLLYNHCGVSHEENPTSRGGQVVSLSTNEATDPGSILGLAIFLGSGQTDSKRFESRGSYSSAIK